MVEFNTLLVDRGQQLAGERAAAEAQHAQVMDGVRAALPRLDARIAQLGDENRAKRQQIEAFKKHMAEIKTSKKR